MEYIAQERSEQATISEANGICHSPQEFCLSSLLHIHKAFVGAGAMGLGWFDMCARRAAETVYCSTTSAATNY